MKLVKDVYDNGGVVAGICHAGSLLVSAGIICGKLVTSKCPADLPFFAKALIAGLRK